MSETELKIILVDSLSDEVKAQDEGDGAGTGRTSNEKKKSGEKGTGTEGPEKKKREPVESDGETIAKSLTKGIKSLETMLVRTLGVLRAPKAATRAVTGISKRADSVVQWLSRRFGNEPKRGRKGKAGTPEARRVSLRRRINRARTRARLVADRVRRSRPVRAVAGAARRTATRVQTGVRKFREGLRADLKDVRDSAFGRRVAKMAAPITRPLGRAARAAGRGVRGAARAVARPVRQAAGAVGRTVGRVAGRVSGGVAAIGGAKAAAAAGGAAGGVSAGALAIAGPVAAVVAGFVALAAASAVLVRMFSKQSQDLRDFSGALSGVLAEREGEALQNRMERAQKIGPELASLEKTRSKFDDALYDLWTEVLSLLLEFKPILEFMMDGATVIMRGMETVINLLQAIWKTITLQWVDAFKEFGEAKESLEKMTEAMADLFSSEDTPENDVVTNMILGHNPFAPTGNPQNANPLPPGAIGP